MTSEMPFLLFSFCAGEDPRRVVGLNSRPTKVPYLGRPRLPFVFPPSLACLVRVDIRTLSALRTPE